MRNNVSIKKIRTLIVGKFAGLLVLAVLAMIFVTPLMASPAMCGRSPLPGNWTEVQVIQGFTLKQDGSIDKFTKNTTTQDIRLGSWVEVQQGSQKLPVVVVKATLKGNKYEIISFNNAFQNPDAWQVNFSVDINQVKDCNLNPQNKACTIPVLGPNDPSVTLASSTPIVDTSLTPNPNKAPLMLGSWVKVNLNGKMVAAAMIGSIKQHTDSTLGGYARGYIPSSDGNLNGQLVKITMTSDMMNQIQNGTKAAGISGW